MTTKIVKMVITEEHESAIVSLRISLANDCGYFNVCVAEMEGALMGENIAAQIHANNKYREALRILNEIEDAIKRFREGRQQAFEEE